ncbi:MAG: hypothetical protein AB1806_16390 [Acidobacteriota bacterium]
MPSPRRMQPAVVAFLIIAIGVSAVLAQTVKVDKKVQKAAEEEQQAILKIVGEIETGTPLPSGYAVTLSSSYFKAGDKQTWIPMTVAFPTKAASANGYTLYLQATLAGEAGKAQAEREAAEAKKKADAARKAALEAEELTAVAQVEQSRKGPSPIVQQVYYLEAGKATGVLSVARGISLPPGEYELLVLVRDRSWNQDPRRNQSKRDVELRAGALRQTITVPDYWTAGLTTSSVLLADKVEPVKQELAPDALVKRPYVFGNDEWMPATDNRFAQSESLAFYFQIYNPTLGPDKRPDVSIDYLFYVKPASEGASAKERYFNKTETAVFNSTTLPPSFDGAVHVLPGAQEIPLASFEPGEYRLEITVNDKLGKKSVKRNVVFVVG